MDTRRSDKNKSRFLYSFAIIKSCRSRLKSCKKSIRGAWRMIPKQKTDYEEVSGKGRPFDMRSFKREPQNDAERNRQQVISLEDLNQDGKAPVNFVRKAGRTLQTFGKYWTRDESAEDEDDIL